MGRRKIQIEPITHQRNRMVTFLKRKHGLFKKAHELGVLCSVDVAVIVFEERPNGRVKLHEYCSSDLKALIDRHSCYRGERETLKPANFAGKGGDLKVFDAEDIDNEDGGDDLVDEQVCKQEIALAPVHRVAKRSHEGDTSTSPVERAVAQFRQPYSPPSASTPIARIPRQPSTSSLSQPEDERASLPHNTSHLNRKEQRQNCVKRQRLSIVPPELPYQLQQYAPSLVTNLTPSNAYTHPYPSFLPSSFRTALPPGTIASPIASASSGGGSPYDALGLYSSQHNQLDMQNISQRSVYHGQYNAFMPVPSPPWR